MFIPINEIIVQKSRLPLEQKFQLLFDRFESIVKG